jgi:hypothetical protein
MPSINHLAVYSRVQNHPPTTQVVPARAVHFGIQSTARQDKTNQNPGCCSTLFAWFRNLFRRDPQAQQPPAPQMQERTPLRQEATQSNYLSIPEEGPSSLPRPPLHRQASGPVTVPGREDEGEGPWTPIHIMAQRSREEFNRLRTGLGIPFTPPEVAETKRQQQKKYGDSV